MISASTVVSSGISVGCRFESCLGRNPHGVCRNVEVLQSLSRMRVSPARFPGLKSFRAPPTATMEAPSGRVRLWEDVD